MLEHNEFQTAKQCFKNADRFITSTIHWMSEVYRLTPGQQADLDRLDAKRIAIRDAGYDKYSVMPAIEAMLGVQNSVQDIMFKVSRGAAKASKVKARR